MDFIAKWVMGASNTALMDKINEYRLQEQEYGSRDSHNVAALIKMMEDELGRRKSNQ